ncbi:MAG: aminotransferase class I/II-fold pyridoxal phosphate-dependent enzyme [Marivibrio sp.]|uniref:aminotransferase class I/II-fold pyridoxal phosphate-dependent enzyme n=1 Tax=Marivibrio sp. TaxID=2039719 RepID=UPI0032F03A79
MSDVIPLAVPDLRGAEARYLEECVTDNWVSSAGPFVGAFETRMAALAGRREGVACVNGTAALQIALMGLGIGPGDRVIVPDWTFAASVNAVIHAGAEPVFADVSREDWCLDPASVDEAAARYGEGLRAAVLVDPLGKTASPETATYLRERHGLLVLEDAAGAIGASRGGASAGSLGAAACFSFNGNKTVTAGGGGMVVTDDEALAKRLRHLTTQARIGADYRHDAVGFNYRMTNVNAAIGVAQLERLEEMVAAKRAIAEAYRASIAERADIAFMPFDGDGDGAVDSGWLSAVRVADEPTMRDLVSHLNAAGIAARPFWCALSSQAPYSGYPSVATPVAHALTDVVVTLPSSSHLDRESLARVTAALEAWRGPEVPPL